MKKYFFTNRPRSLNSEKCALSNDIAFIRKDTIYKVNYEEYWYFCKFIKTKIFWQFFGYKRS